MAAVLAAGIYAAVSVPHSSTDTEIHTTWTASMDPLVYVPISPFRLQSDRTYLNVRDGSYLGSLSNFSVTFAWFGSPLDVDATCMSVINTTFRTDVLPNTGLNTQHSIVNTRDNPYQYRYTWNEKACRLMLRIGDDRFTLVLRAETTRAINSTTSDAFTLCPSYGIRDGESVSSYVYGTDVMTWLASPNFGGVDRSTCMLVTATGITRRTEGSPDGYNGNWSDA